MSTGQTHIAPQVVGVRFSFVFLCPFNILDTAVQNIYLYLEIILLLEIESSWGMRFHHFFASFVWSQLF